MSSRDQLDHYLKYLSTIKWLSDLILHETDYYKGIIKSAKEHVMQLTGCSSEKFDDLWGIGINCFIFDTADKPIVDCFYEYVENIHKARQYPATLHLHTED